MPSPKPKSRADLSNPDAIEAFTSTLANALQFATLHSGIYLSTFNDEFDAARKCAAKYRGTWLSGYDFDEIVRTVTSKHIVQFQSEKGEKILGRLLPLDAIRGLATFVVAFVQTLPRTYDIWFPLPRVLIKEDVQLAPRVKLVRTPESPKNALNSLINILGSTHEPPGSASYLSISASGYVGSGLAQSAMHDAMSMMKRVLQLAAIMGLIEIDSFLSEKNQSLARALGGAASAPLVDAYVHDLHADEPATPMNILLPMGMSTYLRKIALNDGSSATFRIPKISPESREVDLAKYLRCGAFLFTDDQQIEETKSLRSAFEWSFDAAADEDPTGSFIKTCIALEATLSDGLDKEQISQRLGDRCAYLVGDRPSTRRQTKANFEKIYDLRSELVHGAKTRIQGEDDQLVESLASNYTTWILMKEVERLEAWAVKSNFLPIYPAITN